MFTVPPPPLIQVFSFHSVGSVTLTLDEALAMFGHSLVLTQIRALLRGDTVFTDDDALVPDWRV